MLPAGSSRPGPFSTTLPLPGAMHEPLDLAMLDQHPLLAQIHAAWRAAHVEGKPPLRLDPLELPPAALPYVMLLRFDDARRLSVTLAGSFVCALHGGELRGASTDDFFAPEQATSVIDAASEAVTSGTPGFATRRYVALSRRSWSYTRLLLPLAPDADGRQRIFKVLDPQSLEGSDQFAWVVRRKDATR